MKSQVKCFFRHTKAERIHYHQIPTEGNIKGCQSGKGKMISDQDLHKRNKRTRNGNCTGKYMIIFLLIKYLQMIIRCLNKNNNKVWDYIRYNKLYDNNTTDVERAEVEVCYSKILILHVKSYNIYLKVDGGQLDLYTICPKATT